MLSEMDTWSLDGVPGCTIDATLGCRDGSLCAATAAEIPGMEDAVEDGVSVLGVCTTRKVRGAVLIAGEAIGLSVSLTEDGKAGKASRCGLSEAAPSTTELMLARAAESVTAAVMSSFPGCLRF